MKYRYRLSCRLKPLGWLLAVALSVVTSLDSSMRFSVTHHPAAFGATLYGLVGVAMTSFAVCFTLYAWSEVSIDGNALCERSFGKSSVVDLSQPYTVVCSYFGRRSPQAIHPTDSVVEIRQNGVLVRFQPLSVETPIDITDPQWAFLREPFEKWINRFDPKPNANGKK